MFSQTTEYALRAVVLLATRPDTPMRTLDISNASQVPMDYLFKVLQALARAGIVKASRGIHGGYMLARPANQLTPMEVINAIDPLPRIKTCPLNLAEHQDRLCALHHRLDDAIAMVHTALSSVTIADIVTDPLRHTPLGKLCPANQAR